MTTRTYDTIGPGGMPTLTPYMANYVNTYALTAATAKTVTWPAGYYFCNITGDGTANYAVRADGSAAVTPAADVTDGTGSAFNVAQRQRQDETTFSIISASTMKISIEFWQGTQGV